MISKINNKYNRKIMKIELMDNVVVEMNNFVVMHIVIFVD